MSQPRKATHRKLTASSSQAAPSLNLQELQSSAGLSGKRPIYPNVPKRKQLASSNNEHEVAMDTISTASRIFFEPPTTRRSDKVSSSDQNIRNRRNLELISKYTTPQGDFDSDVQSSSPPDNRMQMSSSSQPTLGGKNKRCLSPLNELNRSGIESKRTRSVLDDDEEELSQLLDYRRHKSIVSSQTTDESDSQITSGRKPTARKLSISQRLSVISPPTSWSQPMSSTAEKQNVTSLIELNDETIENEKTDSSRKHHRQSVGFEDRVNHTSSTPKTSPIGHHPLVQSSALSPPSIKSMNKQTTGRSINQSPTSSHAGERRLSWASSTSLAFDTPQSSFSRTTTNQTISSSPTVLKNDAATEVSSVSNMEMITQLISQTKLNTVDNQTDTDSSPPELSRQLFRQSTFVSPNTNYQTRHSLVKQQLLRLGRYEIEVLFPGDHDRINTIYACDLCFKHFQGSSMAFQRHSSKCLSTRPPGQLVFAEDEFGIFQIGDTSMNVEQRIYVRSLCRTARLFLDSSRSVDDTNIDRFAYYILCRRDPVLFPSQTPIYRFVGYFSKLRPEHAQQSCASLSCLFVLPPFAHQHDYYQLLIAFSYFLVRSNGSETLNYGSPVGPLDRRASAAFHTHCREMIFTYLKDLQESSVESIARRTLIHPRDLLSSLYSNHCLASHPTDMSSVYLCNYAQHSSQSSSSGMKTKLFDSPHEKKIPIGQKSNAHLLEEIILD